MNQELRIRGKKKKKYNSLFMIRDSRKGFTLIEVLIIVGIVATLSLSSVGFLSRFFTQNAVSNSVDQLTGQLRKAQIYAMAGKQNGNWGVRYATASSQIILFQGDTYASRNTALDEKFTFNSNISVTGMTDIIFTRMTGTPSASATVVISGANNSDTISVNSLGVVGSGASTSTWFNTAYLYKKKITIDYTKVSGGADLSNFPVLVSVTDTELKSIANGGFVSNSNGYDIIFTDSTETTQYDHEIEKYDPVTGTIQMWVRIPTLSASANTVLYVYFDNSAISASQENKTAVWDSNYVSVWHMDENPATTCSGTKEVCDSTANLNNADALGTMTVANQVTGKINGGLDFTGDDYLNILDSASLDTLSSAMTVSFWIKADTLDTQYRRVVSRGSSPSQQWFAQANGFSPGKFTVSGDPAETTKIDSVTVLATGTMYYIVMSVNSTNIKEYINAGVDVQGAGPASLATVGDIGIGADPNGSVPFWDGIIDEVRLSKIVRSAGWITTEYNNQNTPARFFSIGTKTGQ